MCITRWNSSIYAWNVIPFGIGYYQVSLSGCARDNFGFSFSGTENVSVTGKSCEPWKVDENYVFKGIFSQTIISTEERSETKRKDTRFQFKLSSHRYRQKVSKIYSRSISTSFYIFFSIVDGGLHSCIIISIASKLKDTCEVVLCAGKTELRANAIKCLINDKVSEIIISQLLCSTATASETNILYNIVNYNDCNVSLMLIATPFSRKASTNLWIYKTKTLMEVCAHVADSWQLT